MDPHDEGRLRAFVASRSPRLRRTAYLVTGSTAAAELLLCAALADLADRWQEVDRDDDPEAFVLRALVERHLGRGLRRLRQRKAPEPDRDDEGGAVEPVDEGEAADTAAERARADRDRVWAALARLAPADRVLLALDGPGTLDDHDLADALGCSLAGLERRRSRAAAALRPASARPDELAGLLRATLAERADELGAGADVDAWPGVLRARQQARRRRRRSAGATALAVVAVLLLAGGLTALRGSGTPGDGGAVALLQWPARGALAQDAGYLSAARTRIARLGGGVGRVLYAGDVADTRVVMAVDADCPGSCSRPSVSVWTSTRGAPAGRLRAAGRATVAGGTAALVWMRPDPRGVSPWLVVTGGSVPTPTGSPGQAELTQTTYAIEVSAEPLYSPAGTVRRTWLPRAVQDGVASGSVGYRSAPTLRVRVDRVPERLGRSDIVGGQDVRPERIYAGGPQLVDRSSMPRPDPVAIRGTYDLAAGQAVGADVAAITPDAVTATLGSIARQHGVPIEQVAVTRSWYGPVDDGVDAFLVVARLPDRATVLSVAEVRPGGRVSLVVPGRLLVATETAAPVVWREPADPRQLRVVAPGSRTATYRGNDAVTARLAPRLGGGSLRASGPSLIEADGYERVSFYRAGPEGAPERLVAEQDVPAVDRVGDADVPPDR